MLKRFNELLGVQDMTSGNPMSNLLAFSIPLLLGNFAQQMYSTVDSIIVGRYVGDKALSSIGTTLPIIRLLMVVFMAISTGTGIMVAQYFGAKQKKTLSRSIGTAITMIFISSLLVTVIGIYLANPLLRLMNTPIETFELAYAYLTIMLGGMIFTGFYNIISGVLRGLGNSIFPLMMLVFASFLNVVLDIWFIASLDMGVAGAALATIISQAVSAVFCLVKLLKMKDEVEIKRSTLVPSKELTIQLFSLGLPAGITQAIFSMSMVFVQALTNSMGYKVVTCTTAVMRIDGFAMLPNFTFGMAISTFVGQNVGANRLDRVAQGTKDMLKISLTASFALVALVLIFGKNLIQMFTSTEEIIFLGVRQIRILAAGYIAMALSQVYGGIMRGAGDTMPSMWISMFTTVGIRVPLAYFWAWNTKSTLYPAGSPDALFFSLLISWIIGAAFNYVWYCRGAWREKSLISRDPVTQKADCKTA